MNPRFPPRGTPAYWDYIEQGLLVALVDDFRQWKMIREALGILTGLDPIQSIVSLNFPAPSGSGSGSGGCGPCNTIFVKLHFGAGNVTFSVERFGSDPAGCFWVNGDVPGGLSVTESGDTLTVLYCSQTWTRSVSADGDVCTVGGGFVLQSNTGGCLVPDSIEFVP